LVQRFACCSLAVGAAGLLLPLTAGATVRLVRLTSPVAAGSAATLTAAVSPVSVRCAITVTYKSGPSHAAGLAPKQPRLGRVSWTWTVGRNTTAGRWPIVVSCAAAGTLRTFIQVTRNASPEEPKAVDVGRSIALAPRTRTRGCIVAANPDRRCSPGAYYSGLTKPVLCSPTFRTSSVRNVSEATKRAVETAYGLPPRSYGRTIEIDHIVPLEIGGSNAIANLFPQKLTAQPGYRVKDRLENKLHTLVCSGSMLLRNAQSQIAANWQALYRKVFGRAP
jgi:hypothetical protein